MKEHPRLMGALSVLGLTFALGAFALGSMALLRHPFFPVSGQKKENGTETVVPPKNDTAVKNDEGRAAEIHRRVNPAVVTVYAAQELGTGMVIKPEGFVITNTHVIRNSIQVQVKTATGEVYQGRVVDFDLRYDLALIKVDTQNTTLPIVVLANQVNVKPGDRIYALGSPAGKAGTLTMGTFTRITEQGSLQTSSGLLSPGNSGGPLLNAQGEVIGVNKGVLSDNSGLASSIKAVRDLVERYERGNRL